jgi:hypothetical protein
MAQIVRYRPLTAEIGFDPRLGRVRFVVDEGELGQVFLRVIQLFVISIIRPILHTHFHLHAALTPYKYVSRARETFK